MKKNFLCFLMMCLIIMISPIKIQAAELREEETVYYDTEEGRIVNNMEEYLFQLNNNMISAYDPQIEENQNSLSLYSIISEPSKNCSNIFGHKWGGWTSWEEYATTHQSNGPCFVMIKRWRYCERTYCGASQTETDGVYITTCHGSGNK